MQVLRTAPEQGSLNGHLKTFPEAGHFITALTTQLPSDESLAQCVPPTPGLFDFHCVTLHLCVTFPLSLTALSLPSGTLEPPFKILPSGHRGLSVLDILVTVIMLSCLFQSY